MNRRQMFAAGSGLISALFAAACGGNKSAKMKQGPAQYKVRMTTTKGDIVILVHRDWAPLGADHFYELTNMGFYKGDYFFRVIKNFVVQWGINGDPSLNKTWSAISIPDDPPKVSNKIGTVVFAMAGANTRTTQVFINLGDNAATLDSQGFTPFGEVVQGMENVFNLYSGYGDGPPSGTGPDQQDIGIDGNPYLEEHFPKLDYIKTAKLIS